MIDLVMGWLIDGVAIAIVLSVRSLAHKVAAAHEELREVRRHVDALTWNMLYADYESVL